MHIARKEDIGNFFYKFKFFAQNPECFTFIERDKNMKSLAELGIKTPQAKNTILQLTYKDYCSGPEKDHEYPDCSIWTFGYEINDKEVYIKLSDDFSHNIAKCISFHIAELPISYPHKERGE